MHKKDPHLSMTVLKDGGATEQKQEAGSRVASIESQD